MNGNEPSGLRGRVLRAGSWTVLGHGVAQLIRLASNLILTRLILPEAFGLMAIIIVIMTAVALFSDAGTSQALVVSPNGNKPLFRHTAWTVQVLRGLWIWCVGLLVALLLWIAGQQGWLPAGSTYADPRLPLLIAVHGFVAVLQGFSSTKLVMAQKDLRVKDAVLVSLLAQVIALPITVGLAWLYQSVWALVAGSLIAMLAQTLLTHWWLPGERDRFRWHRESLDEMMGFGRWIFLSSIIGFMASSGDRLVLGWLISTHNMAFYAIAYLLINAFQLVFLKLLSSVAFPAISEVVKQRPEQLPQTYARFQQVADLVLLTSAGFLMAAGPAIVDVLYSDQYRDSGWMLSVLAVGLIGMRYQVIEQCYMSVGRPSLMTLANALRIVALFAGMYVGFKLNGLPGAIWGVAASQFAGWPVAWYFQRQKGMSLWAGARWAVPALILGWGLGSAADGLVHWS